MEWIKTSDRMPDDGQRIIALSDTLEVEKMPMLKRPFWIATYQNHALQRKRLEARLGESPLMRCVVDNSNPLAQHSFNCHDGVNRNPADFHWWLPIPDAPPSLAPVAA